MEYMNLTQNHNNVYATELSVQAWYADLYLSESIEFASLGGKWD